MGETFYSALGVAADATADAVKAAYRDRVKESHPDVSDDPDAPRQFKRLTTARDVLTDEDERARYDRLGHATYVSRHVETSVWSVPDASGSAGGRAGGSTAGGGTRGATGGPTSAGPSGTGSSGAGRSGNGRRSRGGESRRRRRERGSRGRETADGGASRHRRSGVGGDDRSTWLGEDWDGPRDRGDRRDGARRSTQENGWVGAPGWSHGDQESRDSQSGPTRDRRASAGPERGGAGRADRQGDPAGPGADADAGPADTGSAPGATRANGAGAGVGGGPADARDGTGSPGQAAAGPADPSGTAVGSQGQPWQQTSAAYDPGRSTIQADTTSPWRSLGRNLRTVGPWLVIHLVLFLGSVAMAWYLYVGTAGIAGLSVPAVAFGVMLVGLVVFLSILHIVSMLYA